MKTVLASALLLALFDFSLQGYTPPVVKTAPPEPVCGTVHKVVSINFINSAKTAVTPTAFAGIRSFSAIHAQELVLAHSAFKIKVPTEEPTIILKFVNISSPSLSPNVFPSSSKSISIRNSRIDNINAKAFSDNTIIGSLTFSRCNISSLSQRSVISGISQFTLESSVIQSISKHGAINATVADVRINNNRFRTLGQESFQFISWDSVTINNNTFDFLEQGSLNAIKDPSEVSSFSFMNNIITKANRRSLVTQILSHVTPLVTGNSFGHACDCKFGSYIQSITGHSGLSSPFIALTGLLTNTSSCRPSVQEASCFSGAPQTLITGYAEALCVPGQGPPPCARDILDDTDTVVETSLTTNGLLQTFYDDFLVLFQVNTTKGILLFLLFCVLCSVITVAICVGFIWIHRYMIG